MGKENGVVNGVKINSFHNFVRMESLDFIDLFSGIGGFHQALSSCGDRCVLASEIDKDCIDVYQNNYHMNSQMNIRDLNVNDIPDFQVLCGGFPCVSFSKAGKQEGLKDKTRGTLFFEIQRILEGRHPKYIFLENVRNLVTHDNGNTWNVITQILHAIGYRLTKEPIILSPHQFGVPQLRERVYILGVYDPNRTNIPIEIELPQLLTKEQNSIDTILETDNTDPKLRITEYEEKVITVWDEFYHGINETTLGFPVWIDYMFYEGGISSLPSWKQEFIRKNKELYQNNKSFIDKWMKKWNRLTDFRPTHKKFEYQAGNEIKSIWDGIIQFRPSGIRVKRPNVFPALVAMVQIPIIGKYKRKLSVKECSRLQSFPEDFIPSSTPHEAYKQFGNSVNVKIVEYLYRQLKSKY